MKAMLVMTLLWAAGNIALAQTITHQPVDPKKVTEVRTALNHITLIEMPEPITRAAIGSEDIRIERQGSTIAIKPLHSGPSTNLFIWTEHSQSSYEILPPGEVSNATFIIDQTQSPELVPKPTAQVQQEAQEAKQKAADAAITQAMIQSHMVQSRGIKDAKDHVNVRIGEVVQDKDTLYVRYFVSNPSQHPYRISEPTVYSIQPSSAEERLPPLRNVQLSDQVLVQFGGGTTSQVQVRVALTEVKDLAPGQTAEGVVCFRKRTDQPVIYRFVFANDEAHLIGVAAVL